MFLLCIIIIIFFIYKPMYIIYIYTELHDNYRNLKYKFNCLHLKYTGYADYLHSLYPFEFNLNHR